MIPHTYINASDAPAQYAADTLPVPRQAVTIEFYWNNCVDMPVWRYDAEAAEYGLDPWHILDDAIDAHSKDGAYFVRDREVDRNYPLFVQKRDLERAGLL